MIEHDPSLCTGCTACMQVCCAQGHLVRHEQSTSITWKFFAGQCSFCGLCVQYCPTHAITNRGKLPPVTGDQSQHRVAHEIRYQPCAHCSRPIIPLPEAVLRRSTARRAPARSRATRCAKNAGARRQAARFAMHFLGREAHMETHEGDMKRADLTATLAAIPGSAPVEDRGDGLWIIGAASRRGSDGARDDSAWVPSQHDDGTGARRWRDDDHLPLRARARACPLQDLHPRRRAAIDHADRAPRVLDRARDPRLLRRPVRGPPEPRAAAAAGRAARRILPRARTPVQLDSTTERAS